MYTHQLQYETFAIIPSTFTIFTLIRAFANEHAFKPQPKKCATNITHAKYVRFYSTITITICSAREYYYFTEAIVVARNCSGRIYIYPTSSRM